MKICNKEEKPTHLVERIINNMSFISTDTMKLSNNQHHKFAWYKYHEYGHAIMNYPNVMTKIMDSILGFLESGLDKYSKLTVIRIDLNKKNYSIDNHQLSLFFKILKRKIKSHYDCDLLYFWVREKTAKAVAQHYHLALAISGHKCKSSWLLYQYIEEIWGSNLLAGHCYHPKRSTYHLSRHNTDAFKANLRACIYRLSYLAKKPTKEITPEVKRHFGSGGTGNKVKPSAFTLNYYLSKSST